MEIRDLAILNNRVLATIEDLEFLENSTTLNADKRYEYAQIDEVIAMLNDVRLFLSQIEDVTS